MRTLNLLAAALLALATPAFAAPPDPGEERLRVFDQVWSEVRDNYYDPGLNGVDWDAVRVRYRPRAAASESDAALHGLLRAMLGELRDAHTRVLTAAQARDRREARAHSAGVLLFEVEGEPVVFDVRPDGPAADAGMRAGMRVLAVNGVPVADALASARAEVGPSSSERAALVLSYLRLVAGSPDAPLRLRLERADGSAFEVALARRPLETARRFEARRLAAGPLYVRFDRFRSPVARRLREALGANRDAPGLILDLRANPGGDGKEGLRAISPLLDRPALIARLATRSGRPPSALLGLVSLPLEMRSGESGRQLYAGPLVILVNEGTGSTAEVIAASLQEEGRARVIGTRSCGCALGVLRYRRLPNGGALAISEIGLVSGRGRRIEGEGVRPDVTVAPSRSDLLDGRDPVLEAAVRELSTMPR